MTLVRVSITRGVTQNINDGPLRGAAGESGSAHHQRLETSMAGPLAGADGDPGASTIIVKKYRRQSPWQVWMQIWECPPLTLKNVDDGPPGGC
jgi:hypothetical protein